MHSCATGIYPPQRPCAPSSFRLIVRAPDRSLFFPPVTPRTAELLPGCRTDDHHAQPLPCPWNPCGSAACCVSAQQRVVHCSCKLLIWRDLNPCYHRESRPRVRNRLKLNGTDSALGHLSDCGERVIGLLTDCDGQVLRSLKITDPTLLSLLDPIPQKPPGPKLETHRELIRQLAAQRLHLSRHRSHPSRACRPRRGSQHDSLVHQGPRKTPKAGAVRTASARTAIARDRPHESRRRCLPNCSVQGKASRGEGKTQTLSLRRKRAVETRRPRRIAMNTPPRNKQSFSPWVAKAELAKPA